MVAQLVRDGGLWAIDVGPLECAREDAGVDFQSSWKLIS